RSQTQSKPNLRIDSCQSLRRRRAPGLARGQQSTGRPDPKRPWQAPDGVRCLAQSGIGTDAVAQAYACLSKILSMAFDNELIDSNPMRRVRLLKESPSRERFITTEEEKRRYTDLTRRHAQMKTGL